MGDNAIGIEMGVDGDRREAVGRSTVGDGRAGVVNTAADARMEDADDETTTSKRCIFRHDRLPERARRFVRRGARRGCDGADQSTLDFREW